MTLKKAAHYIALLADPTTHKDQAKCLIATANATQLNALAEVLANVKNGVLTVKKSTKRRLQKQEHLLKIILDTKKPFKKRHRAVRLNVQPIYKVIEEILPQLRKLLKQLHVI